MVTGAGKNIGKEIAVSFAKEGANVIVCDFNKENAEQTAREIEERNGIAMVAVCDVRDRALVFLYVEKAIERYGKIDILINCICGSFVPIGTVNVLIGRKNMYAGIQTV